MFNISSPGIVVTMAHDSTSLPLPHPQNDNNNDNSSVTIQMFPFKKIILVCRLTNVLFQGTNRHDIN